MDLITASIQAFSGRCRAHNESLSLSELQGKHGAVLGSEVPICTAPLRRSRYWERADMNIMQVLRRSRYYVTAVFKSRCVDRAVVRIEQV